MSDRRDNRPGGEFDDMPGEHRFRRNAEDPYMAVRDSAQEAIRRASARDQKKEPEGVMNAMKKPGVMIAVVVGIVAVVALATYILVSQSTKPSTQAPATQTPATQTQTKQATPATSERPADQGSDLPIPGMTDTARTEVAPADENLLTSAARITLKLALAALLAAMLAFRPRKDLPVLQRNPYVAQTQILLAVVASALMMIVADNAARAFGIFAAASLVRFRTNIRDPKEITVLLISLGIGLATGVGKVEVAVILSLFVLAMLWVLEYYEPAQVFRALELTVMTRKVDETDEILREIFEKHNIATELRVVDREDDEDPLGKIVYSLNINPSTSTDKLSEEIFATDPDNIDSVKWDQKKSTSYIYR
jgi:uncharacterized membrane protein YhiD involved in acid resistance